MNVKYVVKNEHTLGYIQEGSSLMGVLASNKDGHHPNGGAVSFFESDIRPATEEDFYKFRVVVPPDWSSQQHKATDSEEDLCPDDAFPDIDISLPASHEANLAKFHADRAAGYSGSIYEWHKERFGTFW